MKYIILVLLIASCHPTVKKQESMWTYQDKLEAASNCRKPQIDSLQVLKDSMEVKIARLIKNNLGEEELSKWKFDDLTTYQDLNLRTVNLCDQQISYLTQELDSIEKLK